MRLINDSLAILRISAPEALITTYERLSPAPKRNVSTSEVTWNDDEDHTGVVNLVTAVDVRHPVTTDSDSRRGDVEDQFPRILRDREPHRLTLLDESERNALMEKKPPQGDRA